MLYDKNRDSPSENELKQMFIGIHRRNFFAASIGLLLALAPWTLFARVFTTQDEALSHAFPDANITRETVFLTNEQIERVKKQKGIMLRTAMVVVYKAFRGGRKIGTAYFDAHQVRTLPETVMIVIDHENRIRSIDVLEFKEPEDYLPRRKWYKQFFGRKLDHELAIGRGIDGVTGATLTVRATIKAARRVLSIHSILSSQRSRTTDCI